MAYVKNLFDSNFIQYASYVIRDRAIPEITDEKIYISAKSGYNMDKLLDVIQSNLFQKSYEEILLIPYSKYEAFNEIRSNRVIEMEDFEMTNDGIKLRLVMNQSELNKYEEFITK